MSEHLLLGGILVACFVAYNVGGSTTGPAFGPAIGADAISKSVAAGLMSISFFLGAWTIGRRVVTMLGEDLLFDPETTARIVAMQNLVPIIATVGSYLTFRFLVGVVGLRRSLVRTARLARVDDSI